jgi:GcrA cell cycle regulator
VEFLRKWWIEGLSGSVIGTRLGVSRNAVIGKVHRLGLAGRITKERQTPDTIIIMMIIQAEIDKKCAERAKAKAAKPLQKEEKVMPEPQQEPDKKELERKGVSLFSLNHNTCKFPLWNFGELGDDFCGKPTYKYLRGDEIVKSSYCEHHHKICNTPLVRKKPVKYTDNATKGNGLIATAFDTD